MVRKRDSVITCSSSSRTDLSNTFYDSPHLQTMLYSRSSSQRDHRPLKQSAITCRHSLNTHNRAVKQTPFVLQPRKCTANLLGFRCSVKLLGRTREPETMEGIGSGSRLSEVHSPIGTSSLKSGVLS